MFFFLVKFNNFKTFFLKGHIQVCLQLARIPKESYKDNEKRRQEWKGERKGEWGEQTAGILGSN